MLFYIDLHKHLIHNANAILTDALFSLNKFILQIPNQFYVSLKIMFNEFKKFVMRGNVIDMATGIIIGAAFSAIITSLVADVIMPPIGMMMNGIDFSNLFWVLKQGSELSAPYASLDLAKEAGAITINIGLFINTVTSFLIVALAVFFLIRVVNKLTSEDEEKKAKEIKASAEEILLTEIRDILKDR